MSEIEKIYKAIDGLKRWDDESEDLKDAIKWLTERISLEAKNVKLEYDVDRLKSENNELENANRIVQAELGRQYDRVDALTAENKLLSERVKEQNDIINSWKKQYQILCDKHYANLDELKQLRKAYFELKPDHESVHVIVRCGKCK